MPGRGGRLLAGEPLDFLFIDGEHTYEGVKQDVEAYSPFVTAGGLVVFHDMASHPRRLGGDVHRHRAERRGRYRVQEFVGNPRHGFGILHL